MQQQQAVNKTPTFRVDGLAVAAGGRTLITGFAVQIEVGEVVGVTGPSGCGKSTLLRALAGLIDPIAGEIRFCGQRPEEMGWPLFRAQVLHLSQRPTVLARSVRENLRRPFGYRHARRAYSEGRARTLLERVGLDRSQIEQAARSLSVGEQQRVCLVRALLLGPAVLLLDEPTSALDQETRDAVEALIREEAATGNLSALVVSHDRAQVGRWCGREVDLAPCLVKGGG